jgi:hypothetical protein
MAMYAAKTNGKLRQANFAPSQQAFSIEIAA